MMFDSGARRAFRAQLFLPEQRGLFDYWLSLHKAGSLPVVRDIAPAEIAPLLPHICLLEARQDPEIIRFRLAGTALWDIYGGEMTGRTLASTEGWGDNAEYWRRNYRLILEQGAPAAGMLRAPGSGLEHMAQFWMRLPLSSTGERPDMLLGLDVCVAGSRLPEAEQAEAPPQALRG